MAAGGFSLGIVEMALIGVAVAAAVGVAVWIAMASSGGKKDD